MYALGSREWIRTEMHPAKSLHCSRVPKHGPQQMTSAEPCPTRLDPRTIETLGQTSFAYTKQNLRFRGLGIGVSGFTVMRDTQHLKGLGFRSVRRVWGLRRLGFGLNP